MVEVEVETSEKEKPRLQACNSHFSHCGRKMETICQDETSGFSGG